jgi:hypothetical protein
MRMTYACRVDLAIRREQPSPVSGRDEVPMARRTFEVIDIAEILAHWYAGRSKSQIAPNLGVHRRTIGKYVAPAIAAGLHPGGPPLSEAEWAARVREWFPELADTRLRQVTWPAIAEHHDYIAAQLKADVPMATIHQRLRDERGLAVSVASFRRYVAANLPEEARRSQERVLRPYPARGGGLSGSKLRAAEPLARSGGLQAAGCSQAGRDRRGAGRRRVRRSSWRLSRRWRAQSRHGSVDAVIWPVIASGSAIGGRVWPAAVVPGWLQGGGRGVAVEVR